ncbi:MAG: GTPase [Planctomycetota bacterium]
MRLVLLTPAGSGGVAVLRAEGADRFEVLLRHLRRRDGSAATRHDLRADRPTLLRLQVEAEGIDEVLFVDRPSIEASELHVHGSPAVLARIGDVLQVIDQPMPASVVERLLLRAGSEEQLALALEQLALRGPGELEPFLRARVPAEAARGWLHEIHTRSVLARALVEPQRLVLFGLQNAGKSTLFNRLLLADRALVAPLRGSTRDAVVEDTFLEGYPCRIVDTAGEGPAPEAIDRAAQDRGRALRADAVRVLVCDASQPREVVPAALFAAAHLVVLSKIDLGRHAQWRDLDQEAIEVDARDPRDAPSIRARIGLALRVHRGLPPAPRGVGGVAALEVDEMESLLRLGRELF